MAMPYMICVLLFPGATLIADGFHGKRASGWSYTAAQLTAHLARFLPADPAILIATSLVALGGLYWLVQDQFEALDCLSQAQPWIGPSE